jgi:hypothetical protein
MCFETTKSAKAKIAKTDIKCWKYLDEDNTPPCYPEHGFVYRKDVINEKVSLQITNADEIGTGAEIREGYHSYKKKDSAPDWLRHDTFVKRFIIPAGTRYYENKTEYVSETIILKS